MNPVLLYNECLSHYLLCCLCTSRQCSLCNGIYSFILLYLIWMIVMNVKIDANRILTFTYFKQINIKIFMIHHIVTINSHFIQTVVNIDKLFSSSSVWCFLISDVFWYQFYVIYCCASFNSFCLKWCHISNLLIQQYLLVFGFDVVVCIIYHLHDNAYHCLLSKWKSEHSPSFSSCIIIGMFLVYYCFCKV